MGASFSPSRALGAALLLISAGCLRLDVGSDGPVLAATPVSDRSAIVRCPIAVSPTGDGASYGVIWQEHVSSWRELKFARVSGRGRVLTEPSEILPFDGSIDQLWLYPSGDGFRAFYADGGHLYAVGVSQEGEASRSSVDIGWYPEPARLVRTDEGFAFFYRSEGSLYMMLLDAEGVPTGEPRVAMPTAEGEQIPMEEQQALFVAGSGYHLIWRDDDDGTDIAHARLDVDGELEQVERLDFGEHTDIQLVEDGLGRMVLSWLDGEGRLASFGMGADGARLWPSVQRFSEPNRRESLDYAMAGGDGSIGIAWESDAETVLPQIMLATYDADAPGRPEPLALTEPSYGFSCPSIARGPGSFAVAFRGEVRGAQRLFVDVYED